MQRAVAVGCDIGLNEGCMGRLFGSLAFSAVHLCLRIIIVWSENRDAYHFMR